ncbi:FecR domain-containing protein [Pseudomonas sp. NPDC007930]|uniref:FecR domain-containing protein n=1 Tax=Pseudomonas sp. NPDC007930 TaxID=3364417 RepID=UPI0036E44100
MSAVSPAVAERAVEWMVELQTPPVAPATLAQWQQWRAQSPEHERAWQRIEAFGERFSALAEHAHIAQATLSTAAAPDLARRRALKALAALLSLGAGAWAGRDSTIWQNASADYHSAVGEQRQLTLADGTRVLMNTDTAIGVRFEADRRVLRLLRGEVQVRTGHDLMARPLLAHTTEGYISTLGSRFLLRQAAGYSRVAVAEGNLTLRVAAHPPLTLNAGQQVMFTASELGPPRALSDADLAWTDRIIMANGQRLEDFLAEVSRYRPGHLGCASAVANIRVAGTYPLADTDKILQTLGATLNLRVRSFTPYWVTLEAKQPRA